MEGKFKKEGRYSYFEAGEGTPIVVLHGLMGGLSNFSGVANFFSSNGYKIVIPELPLYSQNILKTNVKSFAKYVKDFITFKGFDRVILLGNSLGGHIALYHAKVYPEKVAGLVITGSSGLYENAMGDSYPKRGDYEYIKKKAEVVFYDPKIATKEMVDEIFSIVNDRIKVIKTLTIASGELPRRAQELVLALACYSVVAPVWESVGDLHLQPAQEPQVDDGETPPPIEEPPPDGVKPAVRFRSRPAPYDETSRRTPLTTIPTFSSLPIELRAARSPARPAVPVASLSIAVKVETSSSA